MTSLRRRLLVWLIGMLTAVGVLAGIAAYLLDRQEVSEQLDAQLAQIALNVGNVDQPITPRAGEGYSFDPEDAYLITIWDAAGTAHSSAPGLRPARPTTSGYGYLHTAGEDWRRYALVSHDRTVEVAQRTVVRQEFAADSALRAVLPVMALIPLSWILVGWVVRRVLQPLRSVTQQLRTWEQTERESLSLSQIPDEVMPLGLAMNDLIGRLHAQLEFRKAFISDAAHELRTPLTALRLQARNLQTAEVDPERAALLVEMDLGFRRMSDLISQMLRLARADDGTPARDDSATELDPIISQSIQAVLPFAQERNIDLGVTESSGARVRADPDDLRTLITNLVDNAVRYTPCGGTVDLQLAEEGQHTVLEVRDTGPGIPEELLDRVFDRFYRVGGTGAEGSGLGLSIARTIAERCAASVTLENRLGGRGLVARVEFARLA